MMKDDSSYEHYQRFVGLDYDEFTYDYPDSKDMIVVGDPEHEHSMDSIRLFGEEVIPAFS